MPASKPAAGTLVAANSYTAGMVAAYLLNGPLGSLVNSVGGAQPLDMQGAGMSYDAATESMAFTAAGYFNLHADVVHALNNAYNWGIPACTLLIGYKTPANFAALWTTGADSTGDWWPYNNGNIYTSALLGFLGTRSSFAQPAGVDFANFNQAAVTGAKGGNVLYYVNAAQVFSVAAPAAGPCIGSVGRIGRNADGYLLTGNVQFFYAWTRVLSQPELAALAADPYGLIFASAGPAPSTAHAWGWML